MVTVTNDANMVVIAATFCILVGAVLMWLLRRFSAEFVAVLLAVLAVAMLTACSSPRPPEIVRVPVPVEVPEPPVIERPELPAARLSPGAAADEVARAYRETIEVLKNYAQQLERLLDGYRGGNP